MLIIMQIREVMTPNNENYGETVMWSYGDTVNWWFGGTETII